jgi:hypothetical protein
MGNVGARPNKRAQASAGTLFQALDEHPWYSFSTGFLLEKLHVDVPTLQQLVDQLDELLRAQGTDHVNVFVYGGVQYIGLESRRIAYDRDKAAGTNHVDRLVQQGVYGEP